MSKKINFTIKGRSSKKTSYKPAGRMHTKSGAVIVRESSSFPPKNKASDSLSDKKDLIRKHINTRFKGAWDKLAEL